MIDLLRFRLVPEEDYSFSDAPTLSVKLPGFDCKLADDVLVCRPDEDYTSEQQAVAAIKPLLRAWELEVALAEGRLEFRFEFLSSSIVADDSVSATDRPVVKKSWDDTLTVDVETSVHKSRPEYPAPTLDLVASPKVEALWHRYRDAMDGREPLLAMAYYCLNFLEVEAGGRKGAASQYGVDYKVLDTLGELTSTRGDAETARKASAEAPLTSKERNWIRRTVPELIRRVGQSEAGRQPLPLGLKDLPDLQ